VGLIYLDACLLIYLVERHSRWGGNVARAIAAFGEERFGISPLVKCECLVWADQARRSGFAARLR